MSNGVYIAACVVVPLVWGVGVVWVFNRIDALALRRKDANRDNDIDRDIVTPPE